MAGTLDEIEAFVVARFGSAVSAPARSWEELAFMVDRAAILDVLRALRDEPTMRFVSFIDLCGVDYPSRERRFDRPRADAVHPDALLAIRVGDIGHEPDQSRLGCGVRSLTATALTA